MFIRHIEQSQFSIKKKRKMCFLFVWVFLSWDKISVHIKFSVVRLTIAVSTMNMLLSHSYSSTIWFYRFLFIWKTCIVYEKMQFSIEKCEFKGTLGLLVKFLKYNDLIVIHDKVFNPLTQKNHRFEKRNDALWKFPGFLRCITRVSVLVTDCMYYFNSLFFYKHSGIYVKV